MATFEHLADCYPVVKSLVDNLHLEDLPSFRLATRCLENKTLHHAASVRFGKEHFDELIVFLSRKSLTRLTEICGHPVFGHCVGQVDSASGRLHSDMARELTRELERIVADPLSTIEALRKCADNLVNYSVLYKEQVALLNRGEALRLLRTALKLLPESPVIGLVDSFPGSSALCHKEFFEKLAPHDWVYETHSPNCRSLTLAMIARWHSVLLSLILATTLVKLCKVLAISTCMLWKRESNRRSSHSALNSGVCSLSTTS